MENGGERLVPSLTVMSTLTWVLPPVLVAVIVYEVCVDSTDGVPATTPDDVENVMPGNRRPTLMSTCSNQA